MVTSQITLSPKISATCTAKRSSNNSRGSSSGLTAGDNGLASVISFGTITCMHCSIARGGIKTYIFCKSHCTTSFHLSFGPWNGLVDSNSPNSICLGKRSSVILPTCLSHLNLHSANNTLAPLVIPNFRVNCSVVICSLHCTWQDTPRIHLIQRLRKF